MTKILTAAEILGADDLKTTDIACPEWGGVVRLRAMSALDRVRILGKRTEVIAAALKSKDADPSVAISLDKMFDMQVEMIAACAISESGDKLFSEDEVAKLGGKNPEVLDRLGNAAAEISGLSVKAVEAAAKKSRPASSKGSSSA